MSMQHRGYICEKGRTQGKLQVGYQRRAARDIHAAGTTVYLSSSIGFSCENQLTLITFSYSSTVLMAIGM